MQTRQFSQTPGKTYSAPPHLIHEDTLTPLHVSKFKNSIQASITSDESDDGGSDEEVARIADKSQQKPYTASPFVANNNNNKSSLQSPAPAVFAPHGMSGSSILSRRTPGANRMHNSHSSAFMPTHSATTSTTTTTETKSEKAGAAIGFGLVVSPVVRGMPPRPISSNGKGKSNKGGGGHFPIVPTPNHRGIGMGLGGGVGRKTVYTPTDAMLQKDLNLQKTRRGNYSPNTTQMLLDLEGVLDDDDAMTPQNTKSVQSKKQQNSLIRQVSSFGGESTSSRKDEWYSSSVGEQQSHASKVTRKSSDVSSINSTGSAGSGSSHSEGLCNFDIESRMSSRIPSDIKHLSPTRLQQQQKEPSGNGNGQMMQNQFYTQNFSGQPTFVNQFVHDQGNAAFDQTDYFTHAKSHAFERHEVPPQQGFPYNSMVENPQMNFAFHPVSTHISPHVYGHVSPINVPMCPSPQTIPLFSVPPTLGYPSMSPMPFDQPGWHDIDMHGNRAFGHWGNVTEGASVRGGWNQTQHHQLAPPPQLHTHHAYNMVNSMTRTSPPTYPIQPSHTPYHFHHGMMHPEHAPFENFDHTSVSSGTQPPYSLHGGRKPSMKNRQKQSNIQGHDKILTQKSHHYTSPQHLNIVNDMRSASPNINVKIRGLSDPSMKHIGKDNQNLVMDDSQAAFQKGKKINRKNSGSTAVSQIKLTPEELAAEEKRGELIENPAIRSLMKEFYRKFRAQEKESLRDAEELAISALKSPDFPLSIHWRIYLELADLCKRSNNFKKARELYSKVCELQPYASQGWLERSKLEEECGNLEDCSFILSEGLKYCPMNENLRTKAIKLEERMAYECGDGDLSRARSLLLPLEKMDLDKIWRIVLEGGLMEARGGNIDKARSVLHLLMKEVSWYGPLYLEAFRLERDYGNPELALRIVDVGLKEIPRYGPLWFGAFRICEGLDTDEGSLHLPRTFDYIERAIKSISRELIWKVQMEAAQALERSAHITVTQNPSLSIIDLLSESRKRFAKTIMSCPENLCWKVWLAAGRMELSAGRFDKARRLFLKSFAVVPAKGQPSVILECVRLEEFVGNLDVAKALLRKTRSDSKADWKVWLQSVLMEVRGGNRKLAIMLAQEGLLEHSGTGRLWATLVQLRHDDGEDHQIKALTKALQAVPKSGEVWCEAARIYLNPFSQCFDLDVASKHLDFATKFTPQYGDSFLETMRLDMVKTLVDRFATPYANKVLSDLKVCTKEDVLQKTNRLLDEVAYSVFSNRPSSIDIKKAVDMLDTTKLELRCSNADPNYGKLWFRSRSRPSDTAWTVLSQAKEVICNDLQLYSSIYIYASIRQDVLKLCGHLNYNVTIKSLAEILNRTIGQDTILKRVSKADFVTGFIDANREVDLQSLTLFERRKILFGSDLLLTWKPLN
mmetsp:Transcript_3891/g.7486  ORF Transcript_3891/g.7486 Transcript_3891/m.7486 type:complete len:1405 (-) Transcript_3891:348-4562(-)|eukprot:CAMPEP_0176495716 /NCGR_PEP_ID=MMETSP0200_2-20121128/10811_1 /TAXON_ID=947934 /ORGANISM="Chaetoceros sp., Strain GSL56" /LENGTH=1404 /DNA_ID=CAMNT_0017893625 /DNA_START=492 /DNA_END=4706 /DNA_ORIENTATION=-